MNTIIHQEAKLTSLRVFQCFTLLPFRIKRYQKRKQKEAKKINKPAEPNKWLDKWLEINGIKSNCPILEAAPKKPRAKRIRRPLTPEQLEKRKESAKRNREQNKSKVNARAFKYYRDNVDVIRQKQRDAYKANPKKAKNASDRWRKANANRVKAKQSLWYKANPEKLKLYTARQTNPGASEELLKVIVLKNMIREEIRKQTNQTT
jgi:hypothetical protein